MAGTTLNSKFTVAEDRALLLFVMENSAYYDRYEIFQKAQEQVLSHKTIFSLCLRYHRVLFPMFTGQPSDETVPDDSNNFEIEEDRALLNFVLDNSSKYDRFEIFQAAQKNESILREKTILELYLRYHRFLIPLFTGKLSDETVQLEHCLNVESDSTIDTLRVLKLSREYNSYSHPLDSNKKLANTTATDKKWNLNV